MNDLAIRWSEPEARKPYARPFGVNFSTAGTTFGGIAVSGSDLIYYRQFQTAVLALAGELFVDPRVDTDDPQHAWLDIIGALVAPALGLSLAPVSRFDDRDGRAFTFRIGWPDREWAAFNAATVLDYQEFQAALLHQTGRLYRNPAVESETEDAVRQRTWLRELGGIMNAPDPADALTAAWPWRPAPLT